MKFTQVAVATGTIALVACGSATPAKSPKDIVLTAARNAGSQSLYLDMNVGMSFSASGPAASSLTALTDQTINAKVTGSIESSRRMSLSVTSSVEGQDIDVKVVLYDGSGYVSTDGGRTYRSLPAAASAADQYGPSQALEFLQSIASVTDKGAGTVDGVAAERYHVTLNQRQLTAAVEKAIGNAQNAQLKRLFESLTLRSAMMDVAVGGGDHLVSENGTIDGTLDPSSLDASLSGTTLGLHETVDAHFHGYGTSITVHPPANVTS